MGSISPLLVLHLPVIRESDNFQPSYYSELKLSSKRLYVDIDSAYCDQYTYVFQHLQ